ncbi:MAG: hypothetical protein WDW36_003329 [Sanguina aurantia]
MPSPAGAVCVRPLGHLGAAAQAACPFQAVGAEPRQHTLTPPGSVRTGPGADAATDDASAAAAAVQNAVIDALCQQPHPCLPTAAAAAVSNHSKNMLSSSRERCTRSAAAAPQTQSTASECDALPHVLSPAACRPDCAPLRAAAEAPVAAHTPLPTDSAAPEPSPAAAAAAAAHSSAGGLAPTVTGATLQPPLHLPAELRMLECARAALSLSMVSAAAAAVVVQTAAAAAGAALGLAEAVRLAGVAARAYSDAVTAAATAGEEAAAAAAAAAGMVTEFTQSRAQP